MKYCGGCNPGFDRAALARDVANVLGATLVHNVDASADWRLLVCGCVRRCAAPPKGALVVWQHEEPGRLAARLADNGKTKKV